MATISPFVVLLEIVYTVLVVVVVLGNVFVIDALRRHVRLRKIPNICITSLAIADLFVGLVNIPMYMYAMAQDRENPSYPRVYIKVVNSLDMYFGVTSILHLALISMERCYAVLFPLKRRFLQKGTILKILGIVWITSSIPVCIYLARIAYGQAIWTGLFFLAPLLIIIASYTILAISVKHSWRKMREHRVQKEANDLKLTKTLCIVVVFFVLAWSPFFIVLMVSQYRKQLPTNLTRGDFYYLASFVKILHYSNSAVNPFIYGLRQREYADALRDMFCSSKRPRGYLTRTQSSPTETANVTEIRMSLLQRFSTRLEGYGRLFWNQRPKERNKLNSEYCQNRV